MTTGTLDSGAPSRLLARPGVRACLDALDVEGEETRLVGGCVRDALLGQDAADIDLATTLEPARTMALARAAGLKAVPTGFEHGTVTLVVEGAPFEVTTLREDVETDGRHAVVRFGRDFTRDAERRDFTINALSLDVHGTIHDTTGGLDDLAAGHVRFIGDAATRIREDALRILRFFRFHARFGRGMPDASALAACIAARSALDGLSRERVRSEFLRLLMASRSVPAITVLSETGLLLRITGTVAELGRFSRARAADAAAETRLAALAVQTPEDADRLRERLRLSRNEHAGLVDYARALADMRNRDRIDLPALRGLVATHGPATVRAVRDILRREPRPGLTHEAEAYDVCDSDEAGRLVFPVAGADLVARGIKPGPVIGRALAVARQRWLDEGCPTDAAAKTRLLGVALARAREEPV